MRELKISITYPDGTKKDITENLYFFEEQGLRGVGDLIKKGYGISVSFGEGSTFAYAGQGIADLLIRKFSSGGDILWHYERPPEKTIECIVEVDTGCYKEEGKHAALNTKIAHALWIQAGDVFIELVSDASEEAFKSYVFGHDVIRWAELEPLKEEDLEW